MTRPRRPTGSITKLAPYADGTPRWRISYETDGPYRGVRKRVNRNISAKDARDAERQLRELLDATSVPSRDTIADVADRWKLTKEHQWKPSTAAFHLRSLDFILPRLGKIPVQDVTADMANRFYAELRKIRRPNGQPYADRSIYAVHETLRCIVEYSIDCGLRSDNPIKRAQPGRLSQEQRPELPNDTLLQILSSSRPEQIKRMTVLAAVTGLRPGEVCALQWGCLDLNEGKLMVTGALTRGRDLSTGERIDKLRTSPKTEAGVRTVMLDEHTVQLLAAQAADVRRRNILPTGYNWVWPGRGGRSTISPQAFSNAFKAAAARAGHPQYQLYDLRRWAVTQSLIGGHPEQLVSRRVGHTTVAMTGRYVTRSEEADRAITTTLSGALMNGG